MLIFLLIDRCSGEDHASPSHRMTRKRINTAQKFKPTVIRWLWEFAFVPTDQRSKTAHRESYIPAYWSEIHDLWCAMCDIPADLWESSDDSQAGSLYYGKQTFSHPM